MDRLFTNKSLRSDITQKYEMIPHCIEYKFIRNNGYKYIAITVLRSSH